MRLFTAINFSCSFVLWALLTMPSLVRADNTESWLCIHEEAVGFSYNKSTKTWRDTKFKPEKYVIKGFMEPPADYKEGGRLKWPKWEVSPFGESIPHATCFNDFQDNGDLNCCGGSFGSLVQGCQGADTRIFKFNRNTLRFLESSNEGYFAQGNTYQPPKTPEMTDEQKEAELSTLSKEGRAGLEKALKGLEETNKKVQERISKEGPPPEPSPFIAIGTCSRL